MTRPVLRRALRAFTLALLLAPCGCLVHEHRVGIGPSEVGVASARQYYLLFGLWRLNDVDEQRLAIGRTSYSVRTWYSFWDFVLTPFLLPLTVCSRTVQVRW